MFSIFRRRSRFVRALERYGFGRCSLSSSGSLWIGVPPNPEYGRRPLEIVPQAPKSLLFVEGPEQANLVAAFAISREASTVERLMIGTTHDYITSERPTPYDFSSVVAALKSASLPALRRLSLGDMEQLFNGHVYYGRVGDITHVFDIAPNLEELAVCGCPIVTRPVQHDLLATFQVRADDIGVSGGALSQQTVSNILCSRFPRLRTLELSLDEEEVQPYEVPEAFYASNGFPLLERFGMDWLKTDAELRLSEWAAERNLRWIL